MCIVLKFSNHSNLIFHLKGPKVDGENEEDNGRKDLGDASNADIDVDDVDGEMSSDNESTATVYGDSSEGENDDDDVSVFEEAQRLDDYIIPVSQKRQVTPKKCNLIFFFNFS